MWVVDNPCKFPACEVLLMMYFEHSPGGSRGNKCNANSII